jgi:4-hydroxy-tetrahydrodipicolinate synthase
VKSNGVYTALITPFSNDGSIDYDALGKIIEQQIDSGVAGLVPAGSTGESATLTLSEHVDLIKYVCKKVKGRVQVIAGTGSNSTHETIELTKKAQDLGIDSALLITPYYIKPSQKGLINHFSKVADEVKIPLLLYNIPTRTGVDLCYETILELSGISNICGLKESTSNIVRLQQLILNKPVDFKVFCGDDILSLPFLSVGCDGVVSVASNLIPKAISTFIQSGLDNNFELMRSLNEELYTLFSILSIEQNPIPIKTLLSIAGQINLKFRSPLCEPSDQNYHVLENYFIKFQESRLYNELLMR